MAVSPGLGVAVVRPEATERLESSIRWRADSMRRSPVPVTDTSWEAKTRRRFWAVSVTVSSE